MAKFDKSIVQRGAATNITVDNGVITSTGDLRIDSTSNIGFNVDPDGTLHVRTADSGVSSFNSNASDLIVETDDNNGGITIANGGTSNQAYLMFANGTSNYAGWVRYSDNATASLRAMDFAVNQSTKVTIRSGGMVGIGTTSPNSSAILHLSSTTMGFLPPVVTTTQKGNISSPATGLVVYDSTLDKLCVYTGAGWETVTSS